MGFRQRTEEPERSNPYYTDYCPLYLAGYPMPNCTAYAYGRVNEIYGVKSLEEAKERNLLGGWDIGRGDALTWWDSNKERHAYPYGYVAAVGAVAVFNGLTRNPLTGMNYGHVMVVENVNDKEITLSGSDAAVGGSAGRYFYCDTMTLDELKKESYHGGLIGFIYAYNEPEEDEKEEGEDMTEEDARKLVRNDYVEFLDRPEENDEVVEEKVRIIIENDLETEEVDDMFKASEEYLNNKDNIYKYWHIVKEYKRRLGRWPESEEVIGEYMNFGRLRDIDDAIRNSEEARKYRGEE